MKTLDGVPHDREVEVELLSALVADQDYLYRIATSIKPEYFFNTAYRRIYTTLLDFAESGDKYTESTLVDKLREEEEHIRLIYDNAVTGTTAIHFSKRLKAYAYAREIYKLGDTLHRLAGNMDTIEAACGLLQDQYDKLNSEFFNSGVDTYSPEGLGEICEEIHKKRSNPGIHGIRTLFPVFDNVVKGLKLINLICGPTGFGKTAVALQWAYNIGVVQGIPTLYINYEMEASELTERLLACGSGVPLSDIQLGKTKDDAHKRVQGVSKSLRDGKLYVTGCQAKTIDHTVNLIHQYHSQYGICVVFVDYIGELALTEADHGKNTYGLYGEWLQRIKDTVGKLGMKSVVLVQLNREGEIADSMQLLHKAHSAIKLFSNKAGTPFYKMYKNRGGPVLEPLELDFNKKTQQITEKEPF